MHKLIVALLAALLAYPAHSATLIKNANGIQIDPSGHIEHFTGLLIGDDGRVEALVQGGDPIPKARTIVDAHGRTLLPGLIDAHGHVMELGLDALRLDLVGTRSIADLKTRLRDYAAAHPRARWILGAGWNQELWADKRFPTAADLDSAVPNRPVVLERVDGHALVANSAAMKAAGVSPTTAAPAGGRIENGLFVDAAKRLVASAIPAPTAEEMDVAFAKAQQILLGFGVTGVGSMSTSLDDWNTFRRAGDKGQLNIRLMVYLLGLEPLKTIAQPTSWLYRDRLRAVGVKFFADGALGSRGAWLKQPYSDQPGSRGLQFHTDAELRSLTNSAAAAGFQIATHAIGDAANAQVIRTYEWLSARYGPARRWRIEHAQVIDCADLPRVGRGHMIASMQPTHQTSDRLMAEKRLDPTRLRCAYAWQSLLKTGAELAFGTDFPVESPNPFPGLSAAVSRQDIHGEPPGGWYPEQRLDFAQALQAYTRSAAYAGFAEDRMGALDAGKWADFILVDRDPTKVDPKGVAATQVLETWVAGTRVWTKAPSPSGPGRAK